MVSEKYILSCVSYIHDNPVIANLCTREEEWEFSSAKDYKGIRKGTLCNKSLLYMESGLSEIDFKNFYENMLTKEDIEAIF